MYPIDLWFNTHNLNIPLYDLEVNTHNSNTPLCHLGVNLYNSNILLCDLEVNLQEYEFYMETVLTINALHIQQCFLIDLQICFNSYEFLHNFLKSYFFLYEQSVCFKFICLFVHFFYACFVISKPGDFVINQFVCIYNVSTYLFN